MALGPEEYKRYSKQILLPGFGIGGQEKLKQAKILVVGAGGLGCPALLYLAAAGIGTLGIVDGDVVDISNLHRQVLYTEFAVGKPKTEMAVTALRAISSKTNFQLHTEFLSERNAETIIGMYDVVIDATDDMRMRYLIDEICFSLGKPWVFAGIYQYEGQLSVFNFPVGKGYRYGDLHPQVSGMNLPDDCNVVGVPGTLPAVMGSLQANECLKMILENGKIMSGSVLVMNLLTMESTTFSFAHKQENNG